MVVLWCNMCLISEKVISTFCLCFHLLLLHLLLESAQLNNHKIKSLHVKMYHYELGNRGIIFLLTLVVHVLLIVFSPCNVLWMRITNEQNSATMVTINLKVSMCRDIIANSNITKAFIVNPCDSCSIDINTFLNAIHVHYMDYVIIIWMYIRVGYVMTQDSLMTSLHLPRMCKRLATSV